MRYEAVLIPGTNLALMIQIPTTASDNDTPSEGKIILAQRDRIALLEAQVTELTAERDGLFAQLQAMTYDALSEHGQ